MIRSRALVFTLALALPGCASGGAKHSPPTSPATGDTSGATLAQIYFWRAKPGMYEEYTKYIREHAEPIDHEAQRRGAFLSVTTYVSADTSSTWTHMRVFILRDSAQLAGLSAALDAAGVAIEPDSAKRRGRGQYGATLRDAAGSATYRVLP